MVRQQFSTFGPSRANVEVGGARFGRSLSLGWQTGRVPTRSLVKQLLAQGDRVLTPPDGVTVLIYHRVGGGSGSEVDLDVGAFRAQLEHLREHHRVVTLDAAVDALGDGTPVDDAVVLTFDDGTADFCDVVVPALVAAGVPATLYAATHFIDSGEPFPWDAPPASWAGLRDAVATGLVTIGSHTHTHALLDRADPAGIADELDRSIDLIATEIGERPAHFAYPKALGGSPDGRGRGATPVHVSRPRPQPRQRARQDRPAPAVAHPDPTQRRRALLHRQGRRRHAPGRRTARPGGPRQVPHRQELTVKH